MTDWWSSSSSDGGDDMWFFLFINSFHLLPLLEWSFIILLVLLCIAVFMKNSSWCSDATDENEWIICYPRRRWEQDGEEEENFNDSKRRWYDFSFQYESPLKSVHQSFRQGFKIWNKITTNCEWYSIPSITIFFFFSRGHFHHDHHLRNFFFLCLSYESFSFSDSNSLSLTSAEKREVVTE